MDLNFNVESSIGKEGDIEGFVEGKVRKIKRTIGDFAEDYRLERLNCFYI